MKTKKTVITVLTGAAMAAIGGLLFAPQKGSAMRKKISKKSRKYADTVNNTYKSSVDSITNTFRTITRRAEDKVKKGAKNTE